MKGKWMKERASGNWREKDRVGLEKFERWGEGQEMKGEGGKQEKDLKNYRKRWGCLRVGDDKWK